MREAVRYTILKLGKLTIFIVTPQNDSSSNITALPPAPNITQSLTPDEKEETPAYDSQYKNTGLCSTRKVHSISRSAGLPDAYALGLIKAELKK